MILHLPSAANCCQRVTTAAAHKQYLRQPLLPIRLDVIMNRAGEGGNRDGRRQRRWRRRLGAGHQSGR